MNKKFQSNIPAADYREIPWDKRMWLITLDRLRECEAIKQDSNVDQELLKLVLTQMVRRFIFWITKMYQIIKFFICLLFLGTWKQFSLHILA